MLFIGNLDGTITSITPTSVTQGSNLVQSIDFVSPALSKYTAVNISFILPNGQNLNGGVIVPSATSVINGVQINAFHYVLTTSVTNYDGVVSVGFECVAGNEVLMTYTAQFTVVKAIPVELTEEPSAEVYNEILSAFGYLLGRINNGDLESIGLRQYSISLSYDKGTIVLAEIGGVLGFYKSLESDNIGNLLTDTEFWQKLSI